MNNKNLLAYFGHHKCATVWINSIITGVCKQLELKNKYIHSVNQFKGDLQAYIDNEGIEFLTYANADIDYVSGLKNFKGFHVIRDPRDIAVSSYFSHLHSHPTHDWQALVKHREKLQQTGKDEGLILDIEFSKDVFEHIRKWNYSLPNIMEIKMEVLTTQTYEKFIEIFDFLGIGDQLSISKLRKIIHKRQFSAHSGGRKPGEENVGHHFRKGISGDWKNHFNDHHKAYFKEKYNDLLIKLGYENDENW